MIKRSGHLFLYIRPLPAFYLTILILFLQLITAAQQPPDSLQTRASQSKAAPKKSQPNQTPKDLANTDTTSKPVKPLTKPSAVHTPKKTKIQSDSASKERQIAEKPAKPDTLHTAKPNLKKSTDTISTKSAKADSSAITLQKSTNVTPPGSADSNSLPPAKAATLISDSADSNRIKAAASDSGISDSSNAKAPDSVSETPKTIATPDSAMADSLKTQKQIVSDSSQPSIQPQSKKAKKPKRKPVYRSSKINTIDDMKGKYRSPKRAMFMSLILPGLGQAYIGDYVRSALYFIADIGIILGWRHYVVVRYDRQKKKYEKFANRHWNMGLYEKRIDSSYFDEIERIKIAFPHRKPLCESVFPFNSEDEKACSNFGEGDLYKNSKHRWAGKKENEIFSGPDTSKYAQKIAEFRQENYQNLHNFYEMIGKYNEFILGWDDSENWKILDSSVTGESEYREEYRKMRQKATDYSRMQSWFLGGLVINHLISAVDAALAARLHNKRLYQTDVKWYDRIKLESYVSINRFRPEPVIKMHLPF